MDWQLIGKVLGGIGLFLIGVELIRSGFKEAAGNSLRRILSDYTDTTPRALFSGFVVSSIIQSSSAVAITMIGFVNAHILRLRQAIIVDFGSNLGKITAAWFIVLLGLKVNITAYALPMVGIGVILKSLLKKRAQGYGFALIGFALIFLGINTLKSSIDTLSQLIDIHHLVLPGPLGIILFLAIGILMTIITQSSIAALTIALSAVSAGIIPIEHAAAVVVGLNLGTTSSSYFAAMRASPNAKRLAVAHIAYNLICTAVGMILLSLIFYTASFSFLAESISQHPITGLTSFYTAFIFLSIFVMLPLQPQLVLWLKRHFQDTNSLANPLFLRTNGDQKIPSDVALECLQQEVVRLGQISHEMFRSSLTWNTKNGWVYSEDLSEKEDELDRLNEQIHRYASQYTRDEESSEIIDRIHLLCRASQHFGLSSDFSYSISLFKNKMTERLDNKTLDTILSWSENINQLVEKIESVISTGEVEELKDIHDQLIITDEERRSLRDQMIQASITGKIKSSQAEALVDVIETTRRSIRELMRGASKLWKHHDLVVLEDEKILSAENLNSIPLDAHSHKNKTSKNKIIENKILHLKKS